MKNTMMGWVKVVAGWTGILFALWAAVGVLEQSWIWLKTDVWPSYSVRQLLHDTGLGIPQTTWLGAQRILEFFLAQPGFLLLVAIALFCLFIFLWAHEFE